MGWYMHLAYYGSLWRRAGKDTWHFARAKLLVALVLAIIALFFRWLLRGREELVKTVTDTLPFVFGPILAVFGLSFLWNLLLAPARLAEEQDQRYQDMVRERDELRERLRQAEETSLPSSLLVIEQTQVEFLLRDEQGERRPLDRTLTLQAGTLELRVQVSITAIPTMLVEYVQLELMERRLASNWESMRVHRHRQQYIYFDVPDWVNPGPHIARLIAGGQEIERLSPEFTLDVPKR